MTMTRGILNCIHLHRFLGGGIECYSYPKDRRAKSYWAIKDLWIGFHTNWIIGDDYITTPPQKNTYQPVFQKMGQGYSSRYNDHGQHGLDKVFVVGQENSFCCPKTCCQVAIIYPRGSRGSSSWVKPTTFRESKLLGCCGYLGLTPKEWIQIAVFVFFGYDSSID